MTNFLWLITNIRHITDVNQENRLYCWFGFVYTVVGVSVLAVFYSKESIYSSRMDKKLWGRNDKKMQYNQPLDCTKSGDRFWRGEVSEWLKEHAWKACMWGNLHRGFASLSRRHTNDRTFFVRSFVCKEPKANCLALGGFEQSERSLPIPGKPWDGVERKIQSILTGDSYIPLSPPILKLVFYGKF